jgi:hypothetical protein
VIRSRRRPCDLQPSDVMWISCFFNHEIIPMKPLVIP